ARDLYVGNCSPEMTEPALKEFLGSAMEQVGLNQQEGNCILQVRLSGTFAFIEVRSVEEASHMMNLNGIPFMGQFLKIKRPTKYPGPEVPHLNWDDILAKYMAGGWHGPCPPCPVMLRAQSQAQNASSRGRPPPFPSGPGGASRPAAAPPAARHPSKVMTLSNMVTHDDLADDETYDEILEDTQDECSKFGAVQTIAIPRPKDGPHGVGLVFVHYSSEEEAKKAIDALSGRTFAGNTVEAKYFPEAKYLAKDFSRSLPRGAAA
ncbi:unnamed protein product, partial [Heterosigma akashiwo]